MNHEDTHEGSWMNHEDTHVNHELRPMRRY